MILLGNREQEILAPATNRTVTAIFYLSASGTDPGVSPEQFGMLYDKGKPVHALDGPDMVAQSSQFWKMDDTCEPLIARDPKALASVLAAVARRTYSLTHGELSRLHGDRKAEPFNCNDIVDKATGIPPRIKLDFKKSSEVLEADLNSLPFRKLKTVLGSVYEKVQAIGGTFHGADIVHGASMTAFEYYEMDMQKHVRGWKASYGDFMLARADNLLASIGIPRIIPPSKPTSKPH